MQTWDVNKLEMPDAMQFKRIINALKPGDSARFINASPYQRGVLQAYIQMYSAFAPAVFSKTLLNSAIEITRKA